LSTSIFSEKSPTKPPAGEVLRQACVDAALEILAEADGPEVDLREVARRIGKSRTAPYLCFGKEREGGGRAGLLAATAARGFDLMGARLGMPAADPQEDLMRMMHAWVAFAESEPRLYRLMFGPGVAGRMHLEGLTAARWRVQSVVQKHIEAARTAGVMAETGRSLEQAMLVWALLHGAATLMLDGQLDLVDGKDRSAGFLDRVAALVFAALRPAGSS
jgi:AcrR family transcriptional regulator